MERTFFVALVGVVLASPSESVLQGVSISALFKLEDMGEMVSVSSFAATCAASTGASVSASVASFFVASVRERNVGMQAVDAADSAVFT